MGAVYFLKQKNDKAVKIGYSKEKNPIRRVNSYKTYFPFGLDFIGYVSFNNVEDAILFEKECHNYFKFNKIDKEWFLINEEKINKYLLDKNYTLLKSFSDTKNNKDKDIYNLFIENKTPKEISVIKNVSIQYVYKILKKRNVIKKNTNKQNKILDLLKNGYNVNKISDELNISIQYVYRVLKFKNTKNGI